MDGEIKSNFNSSKQEDTLKSFFESFTSRACSDEGWNETLAWLRTSIWPKDVKENKKVNMKGNKEDNRVDKEDKKSEQNDNNSIAFSMRMQGKSLNDVTIG